MTDDTVRWEKSTIWAYLGVLSVVFGLIGTLGSGIAALLGYTKMWLWGFPALFLVGIIVTLKAVYEHIKAVIGRQESSPFVGRIKSKEKEKVEELSEHITKTTEEQKTND